MNNESDQLNKPQKLSFTRNEEPMNLIHAYKEYNSVCFYQCTKYNFQKEENENASEAIKQQHETEASTCFDLVKQEVQIEEDLSDEEPSPSVSPTTVDSEEAKF